MRAVRCWAVAGSVGLALSFLVAGPAAASANPAPPALRVALRGSLTPAVERSHPTGSVAATTPGVTLGYYLVNGHKVRLTDGTLTIPSSLAGVVGVSTASPASDPSAANSSPRSRSSDLAAGPGHQAGRSR